MCVQLVAKLELLALVVFLNLYKARWMMYEETFHFVIISMSGNQWKTHTLSKLF